jgi:hypothetical protein
MEPTLDPGLPSLPLRSLRLKRGSPLVLGVAVEAIAMIIGAQTERDLTLAAVFAHSTKRRSLIGLWRESRQLQGTARYASWAAAIPANVSSYS